MERFPYIEVSGNNYECGFAYGKAAADLIKRGAELYRKRFEASLGISWEAIKALAMQSVEPVRDCFPELIDEVQGIADGAGLDVGAVMVVNCRYELSKFPRMSECTTGFVRGSASGGHSYLFKNWDYNLNTKDRVIILHITQPDGTRIIGVGEAGQLIRDGMNNYGIGIVNNNLQSIYDSADPGIPSCFMRRRVLASRSFEEAADIIRTFKRAVSGNTMLGAKDGSCIDFEIYPRGAHELTPNADVLTHANHFVNDWPIDAITNRPKNRDTRLRELLMEKHGSIDVPYIMQCMKDHKYLPLAICRHPVPTGDSYVSATSTVGSTIMDFDEGILYECAGNPCEGEYIPYKV